MVARGVQPPDKSETYKNGGGFLPEIRGTTP